MPEYVITLTAIAIVGGLILGAIYFFYNSYRTETAALRADIKAVDAKIDSKTDDLHAKIDSKTDDLHAKIDSETDTLRSEMNAGFTRLDAKIDSKTDNLEDKVEREISSLRSDLRSDLGGRIDANTEKLSELATEVQVHLRTHHLMSEIERITTPPAPRAEEERELEEEANQPS